MEILKSETIKLENYLEDIEEVTRRYYPKGASINFESFDDPITIHLPFPKEL